MRYSLLSLLLLIGMVGNSQNFHQFNLNFSHGADWPMGDLRARFGVSFNPGLDLEYVINKKTFIGIHGHFMLGSNVKENVISTLQHDDTGLLIDQTRTLSLVTMKERAKLYGVHVGRFFNISQSKVIHGPRIKLGLGVFTHYIIFNDEGASTYQLRGIYANGYDRLTRGIAAEQFIGYQYGGKKMRTVFFAGLNLLESKTKSLRPIDFDTGQYGGNNRFDMLIGVRVGATFQLYEFGSEEDVIYY